MFNKKTIYIVAGVVAGLCLLVALFVGSIVGFVFYTLNHSAAAQTARAYLRQNERLRQEIGAVKDFGPFVTGNINAGAGEGQARLSLKVIGARQTVHVNVGLAYRDGIQWRVVSADYRDNAGRMVRLLDPYAEGSDAEPAIEATPADEERGSKR
jgi:hypothetical protein